MTLYKALTIAGSDSGGGAGIQADLKTFQMLDVFGTSAVTAVTAQNTLGVHGIYDIPLEGIERQIHAVLTDVGADAAKTGMLSQPQVIELVADCIAKAGLTRLVVDPVMVAKGGASLLAESARDALREKLLPLAAVVTPNLPEAEVITGLKLSSLDDMKKAAVVIVKEMGAGAAIVKGGHYEGAPTDVLYDGESFHLLSAERYETRHTHGTGCTFSAAVCAELAKGRTLLEAAHTAKKFITLAIRYELGIGGGHGPTNHWAYTRHGGDTDSGVQLQKELTTP
ncbi:bifunctional hydroxymethylpyrimidine kinase/phosphomethylpyrimidine kinase [Paenibacillus mucilaginosus]|uniref:Hydroxymethylpyrimidine/phosphomethylpyrimidine kinase n=3 Tax=Paenibacillus mucilaginosus TaxID=61624 RepID=H6NH54_9BACL|nr:bifunctional hydroxymethylpyrimidine kinase/phosphomethylpyrimidine kinase [Paenibacillus mucilaginosus]AEI40081.1 phosphomethylpyrimidine kinase [Paenibacillus mucilaginosus KNP414]AFC28732.1 phosphomethylpyrimidine kinase [Paenibacillus mucilaginosus 3016]AFH60910.1 phosphomethylpyrimidine kinase [Paenibacillus mucilaginosus K02]MCG7215687.1 bifunctional hydroxymethylpyrimidine kinase/phosphomethylpyrimidine kinase [Paenibacillus mucilaginosus]WDM29319.1 bifunctional hydroxymethylpyrimidi